MTVASPKIDPRKGKKALLRRSMSAEPGKRFSLLYLDLIMKPVSEDLKNLLVKFGFHRSFEKDTMSLAASRRLV
jgi:hypothetical protein